MAKALTLSTIFFLQLFLRMAWKNQPRSTRYLQVLIYWCWYLSSLLASLKETWRTGLSQKTSSWMQQQCMSKNICIYSLLEFSVYLYFMQFIILSVYKHILKNLSECYINAVLTIFKIAYSIFLFTTAAVGYIYCIYTVHIQYANFIYT